MPPSKRDRRIVLQTASGAQTDTGYEETTYTYLDEVWAQVIEKSGREYFEADKVSTVVVTIFQIVYRSDITYKDRIVYNSLNYDVKAMREIGRRKELEIIGEAEVP